MAKVKIESGVQMETDDASFINGATPGSQLPLSTADEGQQSINQPDILTKKEKKSDEPKVPKPISATEIRSFIYVWCAQRKVKPVYEVETKGTQPKLSFECKLSVPGVDYVAVIESSSKKLCQNKAAWDFAEHLVKIGEIEEASLPPKKVENKPESSPNLETPQEEESPEEIEKHGGWSMKNTRQRLNQIVGRLTHHRTNTPDFQYEMEGEVHSRPLFVCKLTLNIKAFNRDSFFQSEEFTAIGRAKTKKAATADCSLLMVRKLYAANFVEKFGEAPFKIEAAYTGDSDQNRKRKADAPLDCNVNENGNWTPELARSRLNQYCQAVKVPCEIVITEKPAEPESKKLIYQADLNLKVPINGVEQEFSATHTAPSKKVATANVSFDILVQLYRLEQIEVYDENTPKRSKARERERQRYPMVPESFMNPWGMHPMYHMPPVRATNIEDKYLNKKHRAIFPANKKLQVLQRAVCATEQAVKTISAEIAKTDGSMTPTPIGLLGTEFDKKPERTLQACFRVGNLAKGLLLNGELDVDLVAICNDPPTYQLLYQISQMLPEHIKPSNEADKVTVTPHITDSAIHVIYLSPGADEGNDLTIYIRITLTSAKLRPQLSEDGTRVETPTCSLNTQKCIQALAEVRRAKWFQACMEAIPFSCMIIRIFRDMIARMDEWKPLQDWALQLLVEKSLKTSPLPLSLGGSFLRVLECLASGSILSVSNGLLDPCEREKVDATGNFTVQQREALTASAQKCLRQFSFRQLYAVLDMEQFPSKQQQMFRKIEEEQKIKQEGKKDESGGKDATAMETAL